VELELNKETFKGFKGFIKDFINENNVLKIKSILEIDKYRISKMIGKKDFYEIISTEEKECEKIAKLILNECDDLKLELIPKILDDSKSELLYKLKNEYTNFPDEILSTRSFLIGPRIFYNIEYLSLFDYLIYIHDSHKGEWLHQYYAYTKIEKNTYKGEWIIAKPILTKMESPISRNYFMKKQYEKLRYETTGGLIAFSTKGDISIKNDFDHIMKNQKEKWLQDKSTLVHIINSEDQVNTFYLPNEILIKLDKHYYDSMNSGIYLKSEFEIVLTEDESYESFLLFIKDFISESPCSLTLDNIDHIRKFIISFRFVKSDIYNKFLLSKQFTTFDQFDDLFNLIFSNFTITSVAMDYLFINIFDNIHNADIIYTLLIKYPYLSEIVLNSISLLLTINVWYDIKLISKLRCIELPCYRTYTTLKIKNISDKLYQINIKNFTKSIDYTKLSHIRFIDNKGTLDFKTV